MLSGSERNNSADRVVRGYTYRDAIAGNDFDSEAPHPAAQLSEHLMAGIALHAIQTTGVHRHYGSLHID